MGVTKDYLHIKLHHVCPMIDGILHAGQCVFSYVRTMLTLKIKSFKNFQDRNTPSYLCVRIAKAPMSDIQTVPVF